MVEHLQWGESANQSGGVAHSMTLVNIAFQITQSGYLSFIIIRFMWYFILYFIYGDAVFRHVTIANGRFDPVVSCTTSTAMGLFGVAVIGMQVRQVARKPQECFVNGQLCNWVHFTLQSVAPCDAASEPFLCHVFKRALCSAHIWEHKFHCFVHYCFRWFPSWLMATFPADRIRPQRARHCLLW